MPRTTKVGPWTLLPAKPGTCEVCATDHKPELPHNQNSLYYQYRFYGEYGRWPTWDDAMAHCTQEMKEMWSEAYRRVIAERDEKGLFDVE